MTRDIRGRRTGFTITKDCPVCGEQIALANMHRHVQACTALYDADLSDLRRQWADGTPVPTIATLLGLKQHNVWRLVRSLGLPSRRLDFMGPDGDAIATLYNDPSHLSYREISHALGISQNSGMYRINAMLNYGLLKPRGSEH